LGGCNIHGGQPIKKSRADEVATIDLALSKDTHREANYSTGARPRFTPQVRADTASQDEAPRSRINIDCALDRSQNTRDGLPLVQQERLCPTQQRCIRVSDKRGGGTRTIQLNGLSGQPTRTGGFACSPRTGNEDRRDPSEEFAQRLIGESRPVSISWCLVYHPPRLARNDRLD
jgi:hypothetical protein